MLFMMALTMSLIVATYHNDADKEADSGADDDNGDDDNYHGDDNDDDDDDDDDDDAGENCAAYQS